MKKFCCITGVSLMFCFTASAQFKTDSSTEHKPIIDIKYFSLHLLPSNYYSSNLGFFCKKELQVQNAIKIPVRFRLGSIAYCDAMEGKIMHIRKL